jgi:hypothetical protein
MNDWYLMIAFIAGMAVGQHLTIWRLDMLEAELREKNGYGS